MVNRNTAPATYSFPDLKLDFPNEIKLNNGIPCWIINGGEDEMVRVNVYMSSGTLMETKPTLSLLTSLMLLEGTVDKDSETVAKLFDYYGTRKSADSYDYFSEVVLTSLNDNFKDTMKLTFDCIKSPLFPENELEVLKRRLAANIQVLQQRVKYIASCEMKSLYYGADTIMGHNITVDDVMAITRDDLIEYHKKTYLPSSCKVIVSGMITDETLAVLNDTIGSWYSDIDSTLLPKWEMKPSADMLSIIDKPGAMQSGIRMRLQTVQRSHRDYIPIRIMVMALGGYFGSRLMSNIREDKGYTYGINASLLGTKDDGCIDISCECATMHTWNVIEETKKEILRLKEELMPWNELETVKQHLLSSLAKTHDTPYNIAGYVSSTILFGVYPEYHNDHIKWINDITPEIIKDIANKYLDLDKLRIVIAGDKSALSCG